MVQRQDSSQQARADACSTSQVTAYTHWWKRDSRNIIIIIIISGNTTAVDFVSFLKRAGPHIREAAEGWLTGTCAPRYLLGLTVVQWIYSSTTRVYIYCGREFASWDSANKQPTCVSHIVNVYYNCYKLKLIFLFILRSTVINQVLIPSNCSCKYA